MHQVDVTCLEMVSSSGNSAIDDLDSIFFGKSGITSTTFTNDPSSRFQAAGGITLDVTEVDDKRTLTVMGP